MNFKEIKSSVKHLRDTCPCANCKKKYRLQDISVIATTKVEGLFEMRCHNCSCSTLVTVMSAPEIEIQEKNIREHKSVNSNDVLDIKNFLNSFDGNFKKIFTK
ncbi:hypothetical protein JKY72_03315 [Candidatus Gracilibacteria bacterium]|nr:hypothetical protein [Candidatus Gracilibacteria bacterium]